MTPPGTGPLAGVGIGWREELAGFVGRRDGLGFVEVVAESIHDDQPLPAGLEELARRGVPVVPHGVRLSLGSAGEPDPARVGHLAGLAERLGAPLVSEHVAFVRGGGLEAGHLLPVPRTRAALGVLAANVRLAQAELGVPLALEHVAALLEWPAPELDEAAFLTELLERTGALLLLDLANLYANARNHGGDPLDLLDALPLERIAYVHVAGGVERDGLYHDTHAHPTPPGVLDLVAELCGPARPAGDHAGTRRRLPARAGAGRGAGRHRCGNSRRWPTQRGRIPRRGGPPVSVDRERLAAEQAALVRALVDGGPVPAGFDPDRVQATAAALARKRAREVARAWPALAAELGDDFTARFLADAARRPPPARGGALADGLAFAGALARTAAPVRQRPGRGACWPRPASPPARPGWPRPWPGRPGAWS